mmetsp:Transcript_21147/g.47942  ORF Transcript_21147/g.47942 Transcript_21147/m.47942 type:complete len:264 (+) Transcript_21147:312-1103(+)
MPQHKIGNHKVTVRFDGICGIRCHAFCHFSQIHEEKLFHFPIHGNWLKISRKFEIETEENVPLDGTRTVVGRKYVSTGILRVDEILIADGTDGNGPGGQSFADPGLFRTFFDDIFHQADARGLPPRDDVVQHPRTDPLAPRPPRRPQPLSPRRRFVRDVSVDVHPEAHGAEVRGGGAFDQKGGPVAGKGGRHRQQLVAPARDDAGVAQGGGGGGDGGGARVGGGEGGGEGEAAGRVVGRALDEGSVREREEDVGEFRSYLDIL